MQLSEMKLSYPMRISVLAFCGGLAALGIGFAAQTIDSSLLRVLSIVTFLGSFGVAVYAVFFAAPIVRSGPNSRLGFVAFCGIGLSVLIGSFADRSHSDALQAASKLVLVGSILLFIRVTFFAK